MHQESQYILLLTSETYKYIHYSDKGNRLILGDGGAACLIFIDSVAEIGKFILGTDGSGAENLIVKSGCSRMKNTSGKCSIDEESNKNLMIIL